MKLSLNDQVLTGYIHQGFFWTALIVLGIFHIGYYKLFEEDATLFPLHTQ